MRHMSQNKTRTKNFLFKYLFQSDFTPLFEKNSRFSGFNFNVTVSHYIFLMLFVISFCSFVSKKKKKKWNLRKRKSIFFAWEMCFQIVMSKATGKLWRGQDYCPNKFPLQQTSFFYNQILMACNRNFRA